MTPPIQKSEETAADGYYKVYEEYAKSLRTWLVAYGIGGPVLFLTNAGPRAELARSGASRCIALAFLVGVALQIALAALNKTLMWANYYAEITPGAGDRGFFRAVSWLSGQFWIDFLVDLGSLGLFGWATWMAFVILTP